MKRYPEYKDSGVECIGNIPSCWDIKKLKHFANITLGKMLTPEDKGNYHFKPYLRSMNIQIENVDVSSIKEMWFSERELETYRIHKGDLLLSEGGDVGRTSIWNDEIEECYIQNSVHKVSLNSNALSRYFLLHSQIYHYTGYFDSIVDRVSIPHLTKEKIINVKFIYPPLKEQTQIVSFLDRKTQKIDELIEQTKQKIELLKEYRTSLINHCVTKGLNPDVEMKDSGIEWTGEIPKHWVISKVKYEFVFVGGGTPSKENVEYWNGNIPWISPKDMKSINIITSQDYITEKGLNNSTTCLIDCDSLLVVVRSGILQKTIPVGINCIPVTINQDLKALSSVKDYPIKYFYYYIKGCELNLLKDWSKEGTTVESIETEYMKNSSLPFPPIDEQKQIVYYLDSQTKKIDANIEKEQKRIELLKEYRQSLISEVVTGKIDVRDNEVAA